MIKRWGMVLLALVLAMLVACNNDEPTNDEATTDEEDELVALEVEFNVPETADADETVELEAIVTFGDEMVDDADEVDFEYWEGEDKDNSTTIDSVNEGEGRYTAEVEFETDGVYSIYAHTTARDMHTMPKKEVIVGEGDQGESDSESDDHAGNGFNIHFMEPEDVDSETDTELMVHLQMDEETFEDAEVRYEIIDDNNSGQVNWVDASETDAGEYVATHSFSDAGTYTIQVHVEDDEGLHEHEEFTVEVKE